MCIRDRAYAVQENLWVAAICAAPSVLGENGLLHGKKYTCYPGCFSYHHHGAGRQALHRAGLRQRQSQFRGLQRPAQPLPVSYTHLAAWGTQSTGSP